MRWEFVLLCALCIALMLAVPSIATPTDATPTSQSPEDSHTLVITLKEPNGSVGYTVTISGTVSINGNESGDSIAGQSANGRLGGLPWETKSSDRKDVIRITGELRDFEYDGEGKIRISLDGKRIPPDKLVGTPPPSPSTPTSTKTSTSTSTQNTTTTSPPTTAATSQTPSSNGGVGVFGSGLTLSLVLALAGAALLLILRWVD